MALFTPGYKIFGFRIRDKEQPASLVPPTNTDGALENEVSPIGAAYSYILDINKQLTNEVDLINRYRALSLIPEVDNAIEDIVNESIVIEGEEKPIHLNIIANETLPKNISDIIVEEFDYVVSLFDFANTGHELFRSWYIDGRKVAQIIVDETNIQDGIKEIRELDPRKIKKIRDIIREKNSAGLDIVTGIDEYFVYTDQGTSSVNATGVKLSKDTIIYSNSGLLDENNMTISYLHKAIKPANQLRYMEDAAVIYTLARAPARRVFYIDVSDMPKAKADQYMQSTMTRYKNKIVYNSSTGEIRDDRVHQTMMDDYWFPRRGNGKATEVTTLPSETISGQTDNITYFLNKLYNALNIPVSRLRQDMNFSLGRSNEITRDEVKFSKFISRLRKKFSDVFLQALRVQLVLKGIIQPEDWDVIRQFLSVEYAQDNYFAELKENEILSQRIEMVNELQPLVGRYYSDTFIRKQILKQSDEMIKEMQPEIEEIQKQMALQQQQQNSGFGQ